MAWGREQEGDVEGGVSWEGVISKNRNWYKQKEQSNEPLKNGSSTVFLVPSGLFSKHCMIIEQEKQ
eukprot:1324502-Rhodomonas_salina.3